MNNNKLPLARALALAVALSLPSISSAAEADQGPAAVQEGSATIKIRGWSVRAPAGEAAAALREISEEGSAEAAALSAEIQGALRAAGLISVAVTAYQDEKEIEVRYLPVEVRGDERYAKFFRSLDGKPLDSDGLEAKARVAKAAARHNGESIAIGVSAPQGGAMPMEIRGTPAGGLGWDATAIFSTYGQRYSGRDVATLTAARGVGHDTQISFAYSEGLANLRDESRGGFYHSGMAGADVASESGVLSARASTTRYKHGGDLLPYDIRGAVDRVDLEFDRPLSAAASLTLGGGYVQSKTEIRAAGLEGEQRFAYASAGARWAKGDFSGGAKIVQGLGGSESFNVAPLGGLFDPTFTAIQAEGRYGAALSEKVRVDLFAAAQAGTEGTPGPMQFYGGGPDRGRAYTTGNIAGPSGVAGSAVLTWQARERVALYAGADAAYVAPVAGPDLSQSSVFVGAKGSLKDTKLNWDVSMTKALSPSSKEDAGWQVMVYIGWSF